ncbi:unnamed protein product [Caenorhabditis sp. 36 PRJEB53466]|nr:unnamed protein product [Caenorhabditis sp. 36 PRJEB53466]
MVLAHPPHRHEASERSLLAILTDPIVSLFRSIPIEILDHSEELSPSQKDFHDDEDEEEEEFEKIDHESDIEDNEKFSEDLKMNKMMLVILMLMRSTFSSKSFCISWKSQTLSIEKQSVYKEEDVVTVPADEDVPTTTTTFTNCVFIRSQSSARAKATLPHTSFVCTLPPVSATFSAPPPKKVVKRKKPPTAAKMAAEVLQNEPHCFIASSSNIDRPFKLLVQKETFLIDAESMSRISPIFNVMCFGKDFEKMDLSREIVDEKSNDIDCFLRAVHDTSMINSTNFALVLRLSNKYQVDPVIEACQNFIMRQHLDVLRADEILTMLISAHEHHCKKEVVQKLIKRLASEGNTVFTKLKISRYLPAQVYGSVISTSMNLTQIKEHDAMNGHVLKMERSKIRWRQSVCEECKSVAECASCEECKKTVCRNHVSKIKCSSDYGNKLTADLKKKIVDFEWQD